MRGNLDFVLETTEQLAWLASALRPSPASEGVMTCYPSLTNLEVSKDKPTQLVDFEMIISSQMTFDFKEHPQDQEPAQSSAGFCWSGLFRNPVLVSGCLISLRADVHTGLEMPLSFMSLLVNSAAVFKYNENIILKGFCSLLVAVKATNDLVIWHLIFNSTGERISFFDIRLESVERVDTEDLSLRDLESRRHVIGWCRDVTEYSGKQKRLRFPISPR